MININSVGMGSKCYFPQVMEKSVTPSPVRRNVVAYVGAAMGLGTFITRKLVKVTFKTNRLNSSWRKFCV